MPYRAGIVALSDYSPFGMLLQGRSVTCNHYRFGFNGKENDNDVHDIVGSWQDYGMRSYDSRICRPPSVDPLSSKFPELSSYQFFTNNPILNIDLDGLEGISSQTINENSGLGYNTAAVSSSYNSSSYNVPPLLDEPILDEGVLSIPFTQYNMKASDVPKTGTITPSGLEGELLKGGNPQNIASPSSALRLREGVLVGMTEEFVPLKVTQYAKKTLQFAKQLSKVDDAVSGGIQIGTKGDDFLHFASKAKQPEGMLDVAVHGSSTMVEIGNQLFNHIVLENLIRRNPQFTGQPIRLISCNTGELRFAQNLANKLRVPVHAPDDVIWAFPNGRLTIGPTPLANTGKFLKFSPQ